MTPRPVATVAGAHTRARRRLFWPFVGPALLLYVVFLVAPTVASVVLSFSDWSGSGTPQFNGLTQYRRMFASDAFRKGFVNTLMYLVVGGVGTFLVSFLLMMVLRDLRLNKAIRAILFFPNIVSPLALGLFFGFVYKYQPKKQGLANFLLESVGLDPVTFLRPSTVTKVVIGSLIWASAGFYITILMAAVDRIPPYLYEDADIAGATPFQKFRLVTLPMIWDVVGVAGVIWTIAAVKMFELVFVLAGPGTEPPPIDAWTMGIFVWDRTFGGGTPDYGQACACAVVMLGLVVVMVVSLRRLMRREAIQF